MGSNMAASHPLAGGHIGRRHPEQGDGDEDEDEVEHGWSPSGRNGRDRTIGQGRVNDPCAMGGGRINGA